MDNKFLKDMFVLAKEVGISISQMADAFILLEPRGFSTEQIFKHVRDAVILTRINGSDFATELNNLIPVTNNFFPKEAC